MTGEMERLGVYLTNALTGWEPPDEESKEPRRKRRGSLLVKNCPSLSEL
ncbi:MAG: hypothetical protein KDJ22_13650 [Candidatus Competibacteraceae bacterium]|nr:hypothetical protein [Candidatus Competibacteraceae bacterium]MCB1771006.1 hypothetical protein [Candidatus Competibacteraceae bacterium]